MLDRKKLIDLATGLELEYKDTEHFFFLYGEGSDGFVIGEIDLDDSYLMITDPMGEILNESAVPDEQVAISDFLSLTSIGEGLMNREEELPESIDMEGNDMFEEEPNPEENESGEGNVVEM
jgi:hypothetical protein